jgi:YfiH family protein
MNAPPDLPAAWLVPQWPAPPGVGALMTTRSGGISAGPWGLADGGVGGMNLGLGSGEPQERVNANRLRLASLLPGPPQWLRQVHGRTVVALPASGPGAGPGPEADAALTTQASVVCAVQVADCMPVLMCDSLGRGVAAAHAGWRGLAAGVLQDTANALRRVIADPNAELLAWCGPAIGPDRFEVGPEVLEAMQARLPDAGAAFRAANGGKYFADLVELGRRALGQVGVVQVAAERACTYSEPARFYSYRRDRVTGRHAAVIWLKEGTPPV